MAAAAAAGDSLGGERVTQPALLVAQVQRVTQPDMKVVLSRPVSLPAAGTDHVPSPTICSYPLLLVSGASHVLVVQHVLHQPGQPSLSYSQRKAIRSRTLIIVLTTLSMIMIKTIGL